MENGAEHKNIQNTRNWHLIKTILQHSKKVFLEKTYSLLYRYTNINLLAIN